MQESIETMKWILRDDAILTEHGVSNMLRILRNSSKAKRWLLHIVACLSLEFPCTAIAQDWVWTKEVVDLSGKGTSLAVDDGGNLHISYGGEGGLKYGFRPAGANSKWFTMSLGGGVSYTKLVVDGQGNPHMCVTYSSLPLRYAHYNGKNWDIQEIAPEDRTSVQFACAVVISPDGNVHLSWYRLVDMTNAHLRYAVLKDGVWQARTLDFDAQSGKWHTMIAGPQGDPYISYDAFVKGVLKLAHWDGKNWNIRIVDSRGGSASDYSVGMGSSLFLDSQNNPHISYYTDAEIRYAAQKGTTWKIETVDRITPTGSAVDYRSSIIFDKDGVPHISYEDFGVLKHAYKDGDHWRVQAITPTGTAKSRFNSMAIDAAQNILYLAYQDPLDGSLKVAVGRKALASQTATLSDKENEKK